MRTLLVVHHAPTPGTSALLAAVLDGARDDAVEGVRVVPTPALAWARDEADATTLLDADGYVLLTPANLGTMSGALKHVFDSTFLSIGGALADDGSGGAASDGPSTRGRPFGLVVHGRYDTSGAARDVLAVTGALGWRPVGPPLELLREVGDEDLADARELGATVSATLSLG